MKPKQKKGDEPKKKTITGSNPKIGVYRTTKERTTSGGVAEPYKYKTESIDTVGYAKGRKNFQLKTTIGTSDKLGLNKVSSKTSKPIQRKDVPKVLKELKKK